MRLLRQALLISLLVCSTVITHSTPALAAEPGLTVTPPLISIELSEDQEYYQGTISYSNHYTQDIQLDLSIRDFGDLEAGGGLFFEGTTQSQWQADHNLSSWLEVQPSKLTIPAGQQQALNFIIHNRQDLSPGGHYAAVLATLSSTSQQTIAINQSLSTLLFVNKQGGHHYSLKVDQIAPQTAWWGQVQGASIKIENAGNTHLTPRGKLELQDPLGRILGQTIINQNSTMLLPGQSQSFDNSFISSQAAAWLPGNYTLILSYRSDGQDQPQHQHITIFSLGLLLPGLVTLTLVGLASLFIKRRLSRESE